jgi:cell division transport system permease protein
MNAWLSQHRSALGLALHRLGTNPVSTLLSVVAIGIALSLPAGGLMLFANAQQLMRGTGPTPQISVFMALDADRKSVSETEARLKDNTAIASIQFLPRTMTLTRMRSAEGLADVIDALPRNPFPDAFVVTPASSDADGMEQLAAAIRKLPQVDHVQIDSAWARRLNALLRLGSAGLGALSLLLAIGLVAITFNTIRLQVLTQRNEIEVSRLLGATDAFISRPFFYFGTLQGLFGGGVAWLILVALTLALSTPANELAGLYSLDLVLSLPNPLTTAVLLLSAAALGWIGTALSLGQHLRNATS